MSTVRAYYDGKVFVPIDPLDMPKGKIVNLAISHDEMTDSRAAERLAAFRKLTSEIHEINKTEPLPPEYDEILSVGTNFSEELNI